ncbi:MAG: hypothetical protein ACREMT_10180, partial [Vulcanimicrobiaceae bacterium]
LTTVTLALTPAQVDLLAAADLNTTLRLALRPPKEPIDKFRPEPLTFGYSERSVVVQNTSAPHAVSLVSRGVTVIDGDHVTDSRR